MRVGITDNMGSEHKFQCYIDWLRNGDEKLEYIKLSYLMDNFFALNSCDAVLLTGGNDVDPSFYGGPVDHPKLKDVDKRRDTFERKVLEKAVRTRIPVLGICRGMQLANVHFGGKLIPDLEEAGYCSHRSNNEGECWHEISIDEHSCLSGYSGKANLNVNSSHHQGISNPASGFEAIARSNDGIVEAMEWHDRQMKSFFLLIQWHPERMNIEENPFSLYILNLFLSAISKNINDRIH